MTNSEAIKRLQAVKAYMTSGNPIWGVEPLGEAFDMAIEALEQSQWRPVSERLPKCGEVVLVAYKTTDMVHLCKYIADGSDKSWWSYIDNCRAWNNVVVAWMPLPEPYKGGE